MHIQLLLLCPAEKFTQMFRLSAKDVGMTIPTLICHLQVSHSEMLGSWFTQQSCGSLRGSGSLTPKALSRASQAAILCFRHCGRFSPTPQRQTLGSLPPPLPLPKLNDPAVSPLWVPRWGCSLSPNRPQVSRQGRRRLGSKFAGAGSSWGRGRGGGSPESGWEGEEQARGPAATWISPTRPHAGCAGATEGSLAREAGDHTGEPRPRAPAPPGPLIPRPGPPSPPPRSSTLAPMHFPKPGGALAAPCTRSPRPAFSKRKK